MFSSDRSFRLILCGIGAMYLICIGTLFVSPNPGLVSSQTFGMAAAFFVGAAVALHVALIISLRSWGALIPSVAKFVAFAALLLVALMNVTGSTLKRPFPTQSRHCRLLIERLRPSSVRTNGS